MKTILFNFYKGWKKNSFILKLFSSLSTLLFFITIISSILISIYSDVNSLGLDLSYEGFDNFLTIYSFSLKSFAGFLALFTIYVTLKRTRAAEKQIEIMSEQNKLNNYFQFRNAFVMHFESSDFWKLIKKFHPRSMTPKEVFYKVFYQLYGSYTDFDPKFNKRVLSQFNILRTLLDNPNVASELFLFDSPEKIYGFMEEIGKSEYKGFILTNFLSSVLSITYMAEVNLGDNLYYKEKGSELRQIIALYFDVLFLKELGIFASIELNKLAFLEINIHLFLKGIGINYLPEDFLL